MIVYIESDFVLELALLQRQWRSCERIVTLCGTAGVRLIIPAYCLIEPYETLTRRHKQRRNIKQEIDREFGQIARTETYADCLSEFRDITDLLIESTKEEEKRLDDACSRLLKTAQVVPLDTQVLAKSTDCGDRHDFSPQDSIVFASVVCHRAESPTQRSRFLNRDWRDFDDHDVVEELNSYQCELLPDFEAGYRFLADNAR